MTYRSINSPNLSQAYPIVKEALSIWRDLSFANFIEKKRKSKKVYHKYKIERNIEFRILFKDSYPLYRKIIVINWGNKIRNLE